MLVVRARIKAESAALSRPQGRGMREGWRPKGYSVVNTEYNPDDLWHQYAYIGQWFCCRDCEATYDVWQHYQAPSAQENIEHAFARAAAIASEWVKAAGWINVGSTNLELLCPKCAKNRSERTERR